MVEDDIVLERLRMLSQYVDELHDFRMDVSNFKAYKEDIRLKRAVERSLQIAIEACLDIGRRIITVEGLPYAETNREVFEILVREEVVPRELSATLDDMAGFRNLMVHNYARIDDAKVYGILQKRLGDFDDFAEAIRLWLTDDEASE